MEIRDSQSVLLFKDKHILTIDDADTIRTYLRNVLTSKGASVDSAATGQDGLAMCAQQAYDLVLLDLLLPDLDGIEVLKRIRAANDSSTIVMVTGHGGIRSAISAVQMGADGYIEKQDITSTARDHAEFLYALGQAMDHRAGITAQRQLETFRADFYSMITHDLRSPSSVILTSTEMLTDENAESLTSTQQSLILGIRESARRLLTLINDYLDFSKIDAGYLRLERAKVDLRQIVESSAQFARVQTQVRQQILTVDMPSTPIMAWCDAERLKQVLDNLLSNAIKHTPAKGQITLHLQVEDEQALFQVHDTGNGIQPKHLALLFTKYHRVPGDNARGIPGTGLGLLIVKEIVEAHGGSVRAESEGIPGKGSKFTVHIPLSEAMGIADPVSSTSDVSSPALEAAVLSGVDDVELYQAFIGETRQHIGDLRDVLSRLYHSPENQELIGAAQRITHTLKGNAGAMQATTIHNLAAQMDKILRQTRKDKTALTSEQVMSLDQALDQIELDLAVR